MQGHESDQPQNQSLCGSHRTDNAPLLLMSTTKNNHDAPRQQYTTENRRYIKPKNKKQYDIAQRLRANAMIAVSKLYARWSHEKLNTAAQLRQAQTHFDHLQKYVAYISRKNMSSTVDQELSRIQRLEYESPNIATSRDFVTVIDALASSTPPPQEHRQRQSNIDISTVKKDWLALYPNNALIFHSNSKDDTARVLSNFFPCIIVEDGIEYGTSEAYFQAHKFAQRPDARDIMRQFSRSNCPTGMAAKQKGKRIRMSNAELETWTDKGRRVEVMKQAILLKFRQNATLLRVLHDTYNAILIEKLPRFPDGFWGVKKDGGANVLGQILMQARQLL